MYRIEKTENGRYAVKKIGGQRASKVFDNYNDALRYCNAKNEGTSKEDFSFDRMAKNIVKKEYKKNKGRTIFILFLIIAILLVFGYFAKPYIEKYLQNNSNSSNASHNNSSNSNNSIVQVEGDISIHFMELGNSHSGDSVYIKAGETDILIDAGSVASSAKTIKEYVDNYCDDGKLEYVVATHRHEDHIAGFIGTSEIPGIFESYEIGTLIDFAKVETSTKLYENYLLGVADLVEKGAKHYNALECYNNENGAQRKYQLSEGIELEILYNYYYDHKATTENNNSVCLLINQGTNHYLFTGDLEKEGEEKLVEYNDLPKCKLYKAGHHGSRTSSSETLLEVIDPDVICVCCCAGNDEYTDDKLVQFPSQEFIDRVAKYTDRIYVTTLGDLELLPEGKNYGSMNGNIIVTCDTDTGELKVQCSNNDTILKETQWFKNNRTWPNT